MKVVTIGKFTVLKGTKEPEAKHRQPLSKFVKAKFGEGPYEEAIVTEILHFCREYYVSEFEKVCSQEVSYTFYREVVWFHEQATALRFSEEFHKLPVGLDGTYVAGYRRELKLIIEQGCLVHLQTGEKRDEAFRARFLGLLNELLFLTAMAYRCSESIAEQSMIEDAHDVIFDEKGLYVFKRKPYYEFVFDSISDSLKRHGQDQVIDQTGFDDFERTVTECLGVPYEKLKGTIGLYMQKYQLETGDVISAECTSFVSDIARISEAEEASVRQFLSGLTLSSENKLPVIEVLKKPHSLNRYLYRPALKWNINGTDFFVFGNYSWNEAENSLILNAVPWGKFPTQWRNSCIDRYVNRKKDVHDKWLDDKVEEIILSTGLPYQRNVKKLIGKNQSLNLLIKGLGEIDFLIICPDMKKLVVAECKHLLGRYDMVNWKNDYDHFRLGEKSFESKLKSKVEWLRSNMRAVEENFERLNRDFHFKIKDYNVEGVFFINTPTFYMYNGNFRIYTLDQIKDVITGEYESPTYSLLLEEENHIITYTIKYPYFRKPNLLYYYNNEDDSDVDRYGDPIKK